MKEIEAEHFDETVGKSDKPILLYFSSRNCKPCNLMETDIAELSREIRGEVSFYKVDTDLNEELARDLGIISTPTLILFVEGAPVLRLLGYITKHDIRARIESQLQISAR